MQKIIKSLFVVPVALLCFGTISTVSARLAGEGLTISPPIAELTVKPGESVTQIIKLTNPTAGLIEVYPTLYNFSAKDETGEPTFSPATDENQKYGLANWINFTQPKIALTSEQVVDFSYTITVPKEAEPGGHYGVVFFGTEPPKNEENINQVSISSMIGSLILVRVPGTVVEKGYLEEYSGSVFNMKPPVDFKIRISNIGNTHFKPRGEITIKDWRGKEYEKIAFNQENGNVLPDSTRKFSATFSPNTGFWKIPFGRFSADLRVVYGESEKTLSDTVYFWIIPWWSIIVLAVFVLVIIVAILFIKKMRNRRQNYSGGGYYR